MANAQTQMSISDFSPDEQQSMIKLYTSSIKFRQKYYNDKKDRILQYMLKPRRCVVCGKVYKQSTIYSHFKTKKHQQNVLKNAGNI